MVMPVQSQAETETDFGPNPGGIVSRWSAEIDLFENQAKDWWTRSDSIVKLYRDERKNGDITRRFALLWSTTETIKPILYARVPKADIQRRFKDQDPVSRLACEIGERTMDYFLDYCGRFDRVMKEVVEDYALVGQGVSWQRYVPHFKQVTQRVAVNPVEPEIAEDGPQITTGEPEGSETPDLANKYVDDEGNEYDEAEGDPKTGQLTADGKPYDELEYEEIVDDYVNYRDWGCNAGARTWSEVYAVWRVAYLSRDELKARFGTEIGEAVPLDYSPKGLDRKATEETKELFKKASVYEIWDRSSKTVYWLSKKYQASPLDMRKDPLGLSDFFPCPQPLWMTTTNDQITPVPDYSYWQDQGNEINDITARIAVIEKAIRVRGLYPANVDAVRDLLQNAADADMTPVDMSSLLASGMSDMSKMVWFWPTDMLVSTLKTLIELRNQLIQDVYQITGFGDILRGQSDPDETAEAQRIKSQWGSLRVRDRQQEVQRYARDCVRIKFEIAFNLFDDKTIWDICNARSIPDIQKSGEQAVEMAKQKAQQMQQAQAAQMQAMGAPSMQPGPVEVPPYVMEQAQQMGEQQAFGKALELLRNKAMRQFRIDIETDSTVAPDENAEKRVVNEFLVAVGSFLNQAGPIVEKAPEMAPAMGEILMFAVRRYKGVETIENALETSIEAMTKRLSAPQPQDNSEAMAAQANVAIKKEEIAQRDQADQRNASLEQGQQDIDRGRLALEGLVAERDRDPQLVVGNA
jgi:hypothetical protein